MQDLTTGSLSRHLLNTATFMLVSMIFQTLYVLVDLYWVSRLSTEAIAAVALSGNLMFLVLALTQMLGVGTTTLISHAIGANLGRPLTKGLAIRDLRQNLSQLRLAPDYIDVMVFGMTLGLGEAGRRGRFQLILPLSALDVIRASIQVRNEAAARDFVADAFAHCKFIAYVPGAIPLLQKAGVDPEADEGLIVLDGSKAIASFIQSCRKLRLWGREMAVKL